jgi:hypothetical protein
MLLVDIAVLFAGGQIADCMFRGEIIPSFSCSSTITSILFNYPIVMLVYAPLMVLSFFMLAPSGFAGLLFLISNLVLALGISYLPHAWRQWRNRNH